MNSDQRELAVFPDTNVFLHCRALRELPWEDLGPFDCIKILIADVVAREIDKLKNDGNTRRAQRARTANALLRQMLDDPGLCVVFERNGKRIEVRFSPVLLVTRETPPTLDRNRPDDSLIEEALIYGQSHAPTLLFSADTGPELKAKRHSLAFKRVPDDWLLPKESDDRDKQIAALQKKVADFEDTQPRISIEVVIEGQPVARLEKTLPLYPALTEEEVSELMAGLLRKYPQATRFGEVPYQESKGEFDRRVWALVQSQMPGVSDQDRADYDKAYEEWGHNARNRFTRLHALLNTKYRWMPFTLLLNNDGNASVDHLLLELNAHGGVLICLSTKPGDPPAPYGISQKLFDYPIFPAPPDPPRPATAFEKAFQGLHDRPFNSDHWLRQQPYMPDIASTVERDRYALEASESEGKLRDSWSLRCEEFRHGREPMKIHCWLLAPADSVAGKTRLHVRATAANLRKAHERHVPINLQAQPASTFAHALQWQIGKTNRGEVADNSDENGDQKTRRAAVVWTVCARIASNPATTPSADED